MKFMVAEIWNYYNNMPIENKITKMKFYKRFKRFEKNNRLLKKETIYDFIFVRILKKNLLRWAKYFEINPINFK